MTMVIDTLATRTASWPPVSLPVLLALAVAAVKLVALFTGHPISVPGMDLVASP